MDISEVDRINHLFTYHPPTPEQQPHFAAITEATRRCALVIGAHTPRTPEQTLALRALQQARFWANAAIACNQTDQVPANLPEQQGHAPAPVFPAFEEQASSQPPTASEISQVLDFFCTPPLAIRKEDEHNWDIVAKHISGTSTPQSQVSNVFDHSVPED